MDREKVKQWYEWGVWTKDMVANAVKKDKLSKEDYLYITGEEFINK